MKTKISFLLLGMALTFGTACTKYPPDSDRVLEDLAVITQYDTKADFNDYKKYVIADNIVKITSVDTSIIDNGDAVAVLAQIDKNMQARGFVKTENADEADLGISVVYYQNTTIYAYYGGWWGYGWGYYYPYYPVYYSSYTTGLAEIDLVDLKYPASGNQLYLRWTGCIRGLLTGTHTASEILSAVDDAFEQTPQLATTAK